MRKQEMAAEAPLEVNQDFSHFLKRLREEEKVSLARLSKGLMTASHLARVEKGERSVNKNARDCLLGRLGIASDLYENLLNLEDHAAWELQRDILHAVEQRDCVKARELLAACEIQKPKAIGDKIRNQFCLVMQAELLRQQGASPGEISDCYGKAARMTVPDVEHLCLKHRLLSIQEVNMVLEYEYYHDDGCFAEKCNDLIAFVESSLYDDLSKVKIYPKVVYYYLRAVFDAQEEWHDIGELESNIAFCDRAIEMLRDTGRAYYLVELLEMKVRMIQWIEGALDDDGKRERFRAQLQECTELADLFKKLYAEYKVPVYMEDCTYLYQQRWMFYVGDVLRIRRKMFGYSQKRLCAGACSVRSLLRTENKESNVQQAALDIMLGKLGLSKEFQRARLVSNDREVLKMKERMADCRNNHRLEEAREILGQIKAKVSDEIPENLQFMMEAEAALDWAEGKISTEEFQAREVKALECTLKVKNLYQMKEVYLTEMELACIRKIQQVMKGPEKEEGIDFLLRFFSMHEEKNALAEIISMYEFAIIYVICGLGNLEEYQLSTQLAKKVLFIDLKCRRIWGIEGYLYEIMWNDGKQNIKSMQIEEKMAETLKQCLTLSHFCKRTFFEKFYFDKMVHE